MNSKLLALEAKKRLLQVEIERESKHQKATDWAEERKRLSKRAKGERERERRTNEISRSQIGRSDVASLASRISYSVCRKPPAQTLVINF
jgi:hypothetical protein